jgi:hypothetical protein
LTSINTGVWGTTGKTPTDHALSNATSSDCLSIRLLEAEQVCQEYKTNLKPPVEDRLLKNSLK